MSDMRAKPKADKERLTEELQVKAKKELNENKSEIQAKKTALTKLMQQDENLKTVGVIDDAALICFLRAAKYNEKQALKRMKNYQKFKQNNPDLFTDLLPTSIKTDWDKAGFAILSSRTKNGELVLLLDVEHFQRALQAGSTFEQLFKPYVYASNQFIGSSKTQINGVILIVNMNGVNAFTTAAKLGQNLTKAMSYFGQSFPLRVKGIHMINESVAVNVVNKILRPFISAKMANRIQTHGKNLESLLGRSGLKTQQLPESFGGEFKADRGWWLQHQLGFESQSRLVAGILDEIV